MKRRKFIKESGTASLGVASIYSLDPMFRKKPYKKPDSMFLGTPVLPQWLYEKGIPEALDEMRVLAGIKTVMTFSHTHVFRQYRKDFQPLFDKRGNEITDVFVKTNPEYYPDASMTGKNMNARYADRDILDELTDAAIPREMKVYARILEPYRITGAIPGFENFAEIDANGNKGKNVCFNHPGYIAYWSAVTEDLVRGHPGLSGFKFGQERGGPVYTSLGGNPATCFCEYCREKAKRRGYNVEVARKGLQALKKFGDESRENPEGPVDGFYVTFLRILANYPDLLSWEKLWMDSREDQRKRLYKQIKGINEEIQVGWHIDHGMTWDLFTRTFDDYSLKGPYSDWLSTAVYFDSMGRRSMNHFNKFYRDMLFGDADTEYSYPLYLSMLGYDPEREPLLSQHQAHDTAFSSDYVYQECRRAVLSVKGSAKVYARPGFDMPGYDCNVTPEMVHTAVTRALDAGVDGLWCGREWNELKPENAEAFGRAVRDYQNK